MTVPWLGFMITSILALFGARMTVPLIVLFLVCAGSDEPGTAAFFAAVGIVVGRDFVLGLIAQYRGHRERTVRFDEALLELHAHAAAERAFRERSQQRARDQQRAQQRARESEWWYVLGVNPDAGLDEARTAFRRLVKVHHPLAATGETHHVERFTRINEAWERAQSVIKGRVSS